MNKPIYFYVFFNISAERDSFTTEYYANPVGIADFEKHCAQRRKYPVLLQIEFNNATKENTDQVRMCNLLILGEDTSLALKNVKISQ